MTDFDTSRISPTAHYTAYVWYKHGLSHPALASRQGRLYHALLAPANLAYDRLARRPNLEAMLLARHLVLDHLLAAEIDAGRVTQVVEVAAGLSPRGFQFARRYPQLRYIEGDLPESAQRKRRLLDGAGLRGPNHDVVTINALVDDGAGSLAEVCAGLPAGGTAILTEGLLGYFDLAAVEGMWRRFARALRGGAPSGSAGGQSGRNERSGAPSSAHGVYLTDLNLGGDATAATLAFRRLLSWFARGEVHLHFAGPTEAEAALHVAGFDEARVVQPSDFEEVDVPRRYDGHQVRIAVARVGAVSATGCSGH